MQAVAAGYSSTVQAVPIPGQRWGGGGCMCFHMQGLYGVDKFGWRSRMAVIGVNMD